MKVVIREANDFKELIKTLSKIIIEGRLNFTKDGLNFTELNSNYVVMGIFKFDKSYFEEYGVEEEVRFGINLQQLDTILKVVHKNSPLSLSHEKGYFVIQEKGKAVRTYKLKTFSYDEDYYPEQERLNLSFKAECLVNTKALLEECKVIKKLSEGVKFTATNSKLHLRTVASGQIIETFILSENKLEDPKGTYACNYSVFFLVRFLELWRVFDTVKVSFYDDYPGQFDFEKDGLKITYILAPRWDE